MRHSAIVLLLLSCAPAETPGPDGKTLPRPDDPAISKLDEVIGKRIELTEFAPVTKAIE